MNSRQGVAITIVLLVTVVALLAFLFSSATLTIASRSSATQERNATQALLAADSGLRTLRARATVVPYTSGYGTFKAWIEANFGSLDLGDGVGATLSVVSETSDEVRVQSIGTAGTSQRTVVQEFRIVVGPPLPATANVPGALTSVGTIKSNSGATRVLGRANTDSAWTYANVQLCTAAEGEYVVLNNALYRVDATPTCGGTVPLTNVATGQPIAIPPAGTTLVTHRPTALAENLAIDEGRSTVATTAGTATLFGVGSSISIGTGNGTVAAVDGNTLTIDWATEPFPMPTEGAVVRRAVSSGVTAGACNLGNNGGTSFPNGCMPGQNLDDLFFKTFGISSPHFLRDSLPASNRLTGDDITTSRTLSGITWVTNPKNNFRDQTGSGILIIENNPGQTINLNVNNQFTGLIYVIGDAKIAGNAQYPGAIIVDGLAEVVTDVQGTADIFYDPLQLLRALAGITFPNPNAGGLGAALPNTWRVR